MVPKNSIYHQKHFIAITIASIGCALTYYHLTKNMDNSSHLMKQTIFNISRNPEASKFFGKHPKIVSKINGTMLQRKGIADVQFEIEAENNGKFYF